MQSCTIFLSCVGRNRPSIPDPYLEVPSAMLPRSIMTTSFQPFWTRWYATEFPIRPEPAIRTWVWAGSFASTGIRMMESFDFCVGLPQGETPCARLKTTKVKTLWFEFSRPPPLWMLYLNITIRSCINKTTLKPFLISKHAFRDIDIWQGRSNSSSIS